MGGGLVVGECFRRMFKFRFAVLYPFGAIFVFFFNSSDRSFPLGLPIILAGLLIRVWSNCYAIKMEKMTTSGPYAFLRHPLYLGTMLAVLGFAFLLEAAYFGVFFVAVVSFVYWKTVKQEENMLLEKFGDQYAQYKKAVPACFPRLTPYPHGEKWPMSMERLWRSKEHKVFIWMLILVAFFYLKKEILIEKGIMGASEWSVLIVALALALLDVLGEFFKKRKPKGCRCV